MLCSPFLSGTETQTWKAWVSPRPRLKEARAQLLVYCRFRRAAPGPGLPFEVDPHGCASPPMPLAELDAHQADCLAAYVTCGMQCGGKECTHRCRRGALAAHKQLCAFRLVPCPQGCGASFQAAEVGQHAVLCASRRVKCSFAGCGQLLHASGVEAHNVAFAQEHLRGVQAALAEARALVARLAPPGPGLATRVLKLLGEVSGRKLGVDAAASSLAELACYGSHGETGVTIWVEHGEKVAIQALVAYPEVAAHAVHVAAFDLLTAVVTSARAACAAVQQGGESAGPPTVRAALQTAPQLYAAAAGAAAAHILGTPGKAGPCVHGPSVAAAAKVLAAAAEVAGPAAAGRLHSAACKAVQAAPDSAVVATAACRALAVLLDAESPAALAKPPGLALAQGAAAAARAAMWKHGVETPDVMLHAWRVLHLSSLACGTDYAQGDVTCALDALRAHRGDTAVGIAALAVLRAACDVKNGALAFLLGKGPKAVSDFVSTAGVQDKDLVVAAAGVVTRTSSAAAGEWLEWGAPHWLSAAFAPFSPRAQSHAAADVETCLAVMDAAMALLPQPAQGNAAGGAGMVEHSTLRNEAVPAFLGAGLAFALCQALHAAGRERHAQLACVTCMVIHKLGSGNPSGMQAMAKAGVPDALVTLLRSLDATVGGDLFPVWKGVIYATPPEGQPADAAQVGTCILELAGLALSNFLAAASAGGTCTVFNAFGVGAPSAEAAAAAASHVAELGALAVARSVAAKVGTTKAHDLADALAHAMGVPDTDMA